MVALRGSAKKKKRQECCGPQAHLEARGAAELTCTKQLYLWLACPPMAGRPKSLP